jgi:predicted transcriptional regulator
MAGKRKRERPAESRWRTATVTIRLHPELKRAIKFIADHDNRTASNWIETEIISAVRRRLENQFAASGEQIDHEPLRLRR